MIKIQNSSALRLLLLGAFLRVEVVRRRAMRIPKDVSLRAYISQLIALNRLYVFYKSEEWLELRADVLDEFHHECQHCLKRGRYTRADCVHHVNEVRTRPDLALSKYYMDSKGCKRRQLVPLCNACHNIEHDKLGSWQKKDKFQNVERW